MCEINFQSVDFCSIEIPSENRQKMIMTILILELGLCSDNRIDLLNNTTRQAFGHANRLNNIAFLNLNLLLTMACAAADPVHIFLSNRH
jgi:hypothetical protein